MSERREFVLKIESELKKPAADQNVAMLAFWQSELDKFPISVGSAETVHPIEQGAVFVLALCKVTDGEDTDEFDLIGTAFAVSASRLLSAYHVLYDEDVGETSADLTKALDGLSCYIGTEAVRLPHSDKLDAAFSFGLVGKTKVTMVAGSSVDDWIVLDSEEELTSFFTVCPAAALPTVDEVYLSEVRVRVVHCPMGKFAVDTKMARLRPQVMHTTVTDTYGNTIETPNGLVTSSSGGVYIDKMGFAVAIHLECTDELKSRTNSTESTPSVAPAVAAANTTTTTTTTVAASTRSVAFQAELAEQGSVIKTHKQQIDRLQHHVARNRKYIKIMSKKHMSFGRGLIISTTMSLVAALQDN